MGTKTNLEEAARLWNLAVCFSVWTVNVLMCQRDGGTFIGTGRGTREKHHKQERWQQQRRRDADGPRVMVRPMSKELWRKLGEQWRAVHGGGLSQGEP